MSQRDVKEFISALNKGWVCLHPTDTIPGLTFNPGQTNAKNNVNGFELVQEFKKRTVQKPFIALAGSLEKALTFWAELPIAWPEVLHEMWPASISFIWQAAEKLPAALLSNDGTIALRCPKLPDQYSWFYDVMAECPYPLPTTSINISGEAPAYTIKDAVKLLSNRKGFFISKLLLNDVSNLVESSPSTLIKINRDGSCQILREGRVTVNELDKVLKRHDIKIATM